MSPHVSRRGIRSGKLPLEERLRSLAEGEGLPRIGGRMIGALLVSAGPVAVADLARRLAVSRASISTNGRLLESLEIVERVTRRGDRRDYLQIRDPCSALATLGLRRLRAMREAVQAAHGAVRPRRSTAAARLKRMEQIYGLAIRRLARLLAAPETPRRR